MSRLNDLTVRWLALFAVATAVPAHAQVLMDVDAAVTGVQPTRGLVVGESLQGRLVIYSGGSAVSGLDVELRFDSRVLRARSVQLEGVAVGAYEIVNGPTRGSVKVAVVRENAPQPS